MERLTRARIEASVGAIDDRTYEACCQFIDAVNAEHAAKPELSEAECYRLLFNLIAETLQSSKRL